MRLTKKVCSTVLVLVVIAITSVVMVIPASAQTTSAELIDAWPKWYRLDLSKHPYQIFYAKVRNTGTEPVYVRALFTIFDLQGFPLATLVTDIVLLPSHPLKPTTLKVEWDPAVLPVPGYYTVHAGLEYFDGVYWAWGGSKMFEFIVKP